MTITGRPRLLVTGASGFIGSAVLRAAGRLALDRVGLCRQPRPMDGIDLLAGDITDRRSVDRAMQGVTMVVHAAGLAHRTAGLPPSAWTASNVVGTRVVVESAAAAGVRRIVCLSSVAVYGSHGHIVSEQTPCRPEGPYAISKHDAEAAARNAAAGSELAVCVVRPATVAGAGDPGSLARLARLLYRRRFIALGHGHARKCLIGVNDLAAACLGIVTAAAADTDTYNLAGPPVNLDQIVRVLAASMNVPPPRLRVPQFVVEGSLAALRPLEPYSAATGRVVHGLRAWLADHVYDVSRYEGRYGRLATTHWRDVLEQEAHWVASEITDA